MPRLLLLSANPYALFIAYGCFASSTQLSLLVLANLGAELAPGVTPAMIIAIGRTAVILPSLAIAPLMGLLIDVYGRAAYGSVFLFGLALAGAALLGFLVLVREPRRISRVFMRVQRH